MQRQKHCVENRTILLADKNCMIFIVRLTPASESKRQN